MAETWKYRKSREYVSKKTGKPGVSPPTIEFDGVRYGLTPASAFHLVLNLGGEAKVSALGNLGRAIVLLSRQQHAPASASGGGLAEMEQDFGKIRAKDGTV